LEVFRKVITQLRLLVCGGDGTVGWVLQTLDTLNWPAYPPMAIMPLGTGNDLARCMGWGGVFSDEPMSQLLQAILHETTVTHLDRLEVFRKVITQLRLLVCGGDGTVGWVLQTLDTLNWPAYPPMAIMPLGTGNDLARCMGWGGVFSDEPMSQLLQAILHETTVTHLDRWRIDVEPNEASPLDSTDELSEAVQSSLPLTVMNNYFSIGADAHVALQFHHSRKETAPFENLSMNDLFR
ncbi:diacylglycerol kinase catalytic domain protein, partial [Ancylostoma caninum]